MKREIKRETKRKLRDNLRGELRGELRGNKNLYISDRDSHPHIIQLVEYLCRAFE